LLVSIVYLVFCRLLELVVLLGRRERSKEQLKRHNLLGGLSHEYELAAAQRPDLVHPRAACDRSSVSDRVADELSVKYALDG
jgi:hypothetical protein